MGSGRHRAARTSVLCRVAEDVELLLDTVGVLALLGLVELQGLAPHSAGLLEFTEGDVRVAKPVEAVGCRVSIANSTEQRESVQIVLDGLLMTASVVSDVTEAVQRCPLAVQVVMEAL